MGIYKLVIKNSKIVLKTLSNAYINLFGIKDTAGTGNYANNLVDWTIQHRTKTTAEWTADTTTILLSGQIGIEDTGNTTFKFKIGNGTDLWSALGYAGGGGGSGTVQSVTGDGVDNTDPANPILTFPTPTDIGLGNVDNTSDINKPISSATQTALDGKVDENAAITGATKTKITYDAKGLVTAGADATTSDIADSLNKRYVTDAQLTVLNNTSGTNSGNETTSTIGTLINGSNAATPNDTDLVATAESSLLKKITWTNVKAFLKTYFDTIYQAAGTYLTSANITATITNGVTDKAPSEDAVFDALALKVNISNSVIPIIQDIALGSPLTGTTAISVLKSVLIPANTVEVGDILTILSRTLRSTATGSANHYLYFNTTNSLSGATLMAIQTGSMRYGAMRRNLFVITAINSETIDAAINSANDDATAPTSNVSQLNIDWTNDVYILQSYQNAAVGDSTNSRGLSITRLRI